MLSVRPTSFRLTSTASELGAGRQVALNVGFLLISGCLVASVVSMVIRLRRSSGEQRQQLRLIALAAALPTFGVVWLLVVQGSTAASRPGRPGSRCSSSYFLMPILFAVAVLRYRLYDLEVIINRTIVVVAGARSPRSATPPSWWPRAAWSRTGPAASGSRCSGTTVVALAFQPLRRSRGPAGQPAGVRRRAQPYEALADFSRRLAAAPTPATCCRRSRRPRRGRCPRPAPRDARRTRRRAVTGTWG